MLSEDNKLKLPLKCKNPHIDFFNKIKDVLNFKSRYYLYVENKLSNSNLKIFESPNNINEFIYYLIE